MHAPIAPLPSGSPPAAPWGWLGALLVCLLLTMAASRWIQGDGIRGDATQNLILAHSLYDRGAFTLDHLPAHLQRNQPSNFREPLPPAVTAVYLHLLDAAGVPFTLSSLHAGEHTRLVKMVNLFWLYLALMGVWALVHRFTRSHRWALAATGLCFLFDLGVNSLYTELPTAATLLWLSWALLGAQARPDPGRWLLAGGILGALCLIKALFLYVAIPLALLMVWGSVALRGRGLPAWRPGLGALGALGAMLLGTLIVTGPWMVRNQILFGSPQLTQGRSGWVLYKRALLNEMSADEFRRGFTVWGPRMYHDLVAGTSLDVQESDLKTWTGSLRRLHYASSEFMVNDRLAQNAGDPDRAVTLYRKTSALYVQLGDLFRRAGHPHPEAAGDRVMQKEALRRIAADPWAHLRMSTLMFWRGMWCLSPRVELPWLQKWQLRHTVVESLNLLCMLTLLGLTAAGLLRRRGNWMALTLPAMGMLGLYTAMSQNLPRFFVPAQPFMLMSLLLLVWLWLNRHRPDASPVVPT